MPDGILNLDKPRGPTSHDVVRRVRALTGVRRVGHAGTLDPLATGVLVVFVGRATRVAQYLMTSQYGGPKLYRARVRMGITTDTLDAAGRVVAIAPVDVTRSQAEAALVGLRGTIMQVPPMYSALKRKGTPLYRLARRGVEVAREPRRVDVFSLELTAWEPPELTLEISCSPGTYVRVIADDLGKALGCGAHVAALTRLASGGFRLDDAVTLDAFSRAVEERRWQELLHPLDAALSRFPVVQLDHEAARRLCLGQAIEASLARFQPARDSQRRDPAGEPPLARAYGPDGRFLAIVSCDPSAAIWRPRTVFCSPE